MADFVDAANGLADTITTILAPDNTGAVAIIGGAVVKIYVGWPDKQQLDADLAGGKVHVSVWPLPQERPTSATKNDMDWEMTGAAQATREIERRTRQMQVSIWAHTPAQRDTLGRALDSALADLTRIAMPDGTEGVLSYGGGRLVDERQTANLYRRDIIIGLNYGVTQVQNFTAITRVQTTLHIEVTGPVEIATIPITTT